ncbi:TMAO reductase system periplasmic protein TorT [uncultured Pseudodesulfovibrio sp.]|uniref:TMAO reductase system periplasmic protein TorT n=1 Tax=uncultured Pseudodesulfovibrio sp. TaxID=2035858 RepID=UPI0029C8FD9F|nr:TMAO reductase system periplasmic protein TorT [uncultured Pseudodesulfovibrio sp.]
MVNFLKRFNMMKGLVVVFAGILLGTFASVPSVAGEEDMPWSPVQVKSYYGTYDPSLKESGRASPSLDRPKLEKWFPPAKADAPYVIGVCFPHFKDYYWTAVSYGILEEAKKFGVSIRLVEAGGYGELKRQHLQFLRFIKEHVDGIILGAVSYAGNEQCIAMAREAGMPVVAVGNDVYSSKISAKALVSFYEMGHFAGEYVAEHAEKAGLDTVSVAFFPGPKDSGWAPETLMGFKDALDYYPGRVDVLDVRWGDTTPIEQRRLIEDSLKTVGPANYLVGNAVAAEVAPEVLQQAVEGSATTVIGTYLTQNLYDQILYGKAAGAPSDLMAFQGRMAVDMMIRLLNGEKAGVDFPFRSGPFIPMVTMDNIESSHFEGLFGPRDYTPDFSSVKAW